MEGLDDLISEITEKYAKEAKDKISLKSDLEQLARKITMDQITKMQYIIDKEKSKLITPPLT